MIPNWLQVNDEVRSALNDRRPVVALESTLIAHGLPWPSNRETAIAAEEAIRAMGAVPATIAVWQGQPIIGLHRQQIGELAQMNGVLKASRRDLALAMVQKRTAATTVAATMHLAHAAGISVFATGGIGGVHRDAERTFDISADLSELARTPMLVVCAGAKSILDLPRTLELLETLSVPVVGYRTSTLPAFQVRDSGLGLHARVESPGEAAALFAAHRKSGGSGMLLVQPVDEGVALPAPEFESALRKAETEAAERNIQGAAVTPFILARLAELTEGRSLRANRALIVANARLAAEVAGELTKEN
jgi:pseudouridylate synthase